MFSGTLSTSFSNLIDYWMKLKSVQGAMARTAELLRAPEEEEKEGQGEGKSAGTEVRFDHVSFSYGDKEALRDVSFTIPEGSSAAVIGLCGSGKTTSLSLLEHFYEPQEGTVSLGGVPVADIPLQALRGRMGYVQQGADVFSGTVREALTYGLHREVPDEEIWEAARKTGFAAALLCPADRGKSWCSPGSSCGAQTCSCLMSPPQLWTLRRPGWYRIRSLIHFQIRRRSSSLTTCLLSGGWTRSLSWTEAYWPGAGATMTCMGSAGLSWS